MRAYVGITDFRWFDLLRGLPHPDDINFWQPSGNQEFKALKPGELFLFKLHSPNNYIVGGGLYAHSSLLPISLAWESFGPGNGASSLSDMRSSVAKYRHQIVNGKDDYTVGCILIEDPFFYQKICGYRPLKTGVLASFKEKPMIFRSNRGSLCGKQLETAVPLASVMTDPLSRYGQPILTMPRLGQGAFRVLVTDAYGRRCAVTNEKDSPCSRSRAY